MSYFQTMYGTDDLNTQFTDKDAQEPVRHGKWESLTFTNASNEEYTMHRCSECGLTIVTGWYHYCPNCGARMDKE
jgi:rubrerythrin